MKKFITKYKYSILIFVFALIIVVSTGIFYFIQQESNRIKLENYLQIDNSFDVLEQEGFIIVTGDSTYSFDVQDTVTNIVFDQEAFSLALSQSKSLNEMVYNGSMIAVFDDSDEFQNYEEILEFPIGFMDGEISTEKTHKTIGYIYQADNFGRIHIIRVNMKEGTDAKENTVKLFIDEVINTKIKSVDNYMDNVSESDTNFLGSITDCYVGNDKKGNVSIVYEVFLEQTVDNYDYYVVYASIEAISGNFLYGNKYKVDSLTINLQTHTADAILYKTLPNTTLNTASYSIDIGFTDSKDGVNSSFDVTQSRDIEVGKKVKSSSECEWEIDIKDWISSEAENRVSFKPSGTFRVPESNYGLSIVGTTEFVVDAWNEFSSTAVYGLTCFYCSSDIQE